MGGMFRALAHRNFRLFWAGAFLSNVGAWMQTVAQGWLVLQLTDSAFWLGVDTFMATVPGLLLTLVAGVYADLVDRKRLVILTQLGAGLSALTLAVLVWAGALKDASGVWIILALSFVTGCCWALAGPSYQAITVDLVRREDLANAIALNSTQFQLARVIGPAIAGFAMAFIGLAGCFFVNAVSYVAIIGALAQVRFGEKRAANGVATPSDGGAASPHALNDRRALWADLLEGFRYVRGRPRIRMLLLCTAVLSFFGSPYISMMPLFARDVLKWGERGLSVLMATAGAGALCGALLLAYLGDFKRKGVFALGSLFSGGLCLVGFALAKHPALSLPMLFSLGFSIVSFFAVCNTLLQQLVTDEMRGRVMSMWILTFVGTMPLGSFLAGAAAQRYGAPLTLAAGGAFIALFVALVAPLNARRREL
jgi:MFS family permease